MKTKNKITNNELDISKFYGSLNFAYCPSVPLKLEKQSTVLLDEIEELSKDVGDNCVKYLSESIKHFYICYSMKVENCVDKTRNNYFYFQLFSQVGLQQTPSIPVYGFYSDEGVIEIIKNVDSMFFSSDYDKQVFDTINVETYGDLNELVQLMQDWTALKLSKFSELYFLDKETAHNLNKLVDCVGKTRGEIKTKKSKVTIKKKRSKNQAL